MRDGVDAAMLPLQAAKLPSSAALGAAIALAALFAAYALWLALAVLPGNFDVSWLIVVCERLLDGERLTVDVMEVNPPFSVWLYMPYVLLERLVGGRAETWMSVGVVAAGLASVAVSCRMLARADDIYRTPRAMIALPVMVFLVLCLFPGEFGQREQLAVIAVLPWLALQCVRQRDPDFAAGRRWQPVLAGVCAGIVVMIKPPHFALALILPSACLAVHRRSWKPLFVFENLLGAALVTAYAASILLFQPSFLTEVLPFVGDLYLPLRESFLYLLTDWPLTVLLFAMLVPIIAGGLRKVQWDAAIPLFSAFGFLIAFMVMGKGWPNHAWPMLALAIAGFTAQLLRVGNLRGLKPAAAATAAVGCFLVLRAVFTIQDFALRQDRTALERSVVAISSTVERPSVVSLAARLQAAHPLMRRIGGDFVGRYPSAWAIHNADFLARGAADPAARRRLEAIRDGLIEEFARDIAAKNPDIVLYSAETGPRWDELVLRNEGIEAVLEDYEAVLRAPEVTVYVRAGAARQRPAETSE